MKTTSTKEQTFLFSDKHLTNTIDFSHKEKIRYKVKNNKIWILCHIIWYQNLYVSKYLHNLPNWKFFINSSLLSVHWPGQKGCMLPTSKVDFILFIGDFDAGSLEPFQSGQSIGINSRFYFYFYFLLIILNNSFIACLSIVLLGIQKIIEIHIYYTESVKKVAHHFRNI